ncbi:hypothetical protein [Caballeronia sp.]|jgi:hypothetical protein|nr:hypothetical protein [Caballeronia sp.]
MKRALVRRDGDVVGAPAVGGLPEDEDERVAQLGVAAVMAMQLPEGPPVA